MFRPKNAPARAPISDPSTPSPVPSDDGWFRGFGGAKAARTDSSFFAPGQYVVEIVKMERQIGTNPKKNKGAQLFIARFRVVEVEDAFPADPTPPSGWPASNRAGEEVIQVHNCGYPQNPNERAYENIKQLLLAVARCDSPDLIETDFSDDEWQANIISATEPPGSMCAGYRLRVIAGKKMTKGDDRTPAHNFTPISFYPISTPSGH